VFLEGGHGFVSRCLLLPVRAWEFKHGSKSPVVWMMLYPMQMTCLSDKDLPPAAVKVTPSSS
jgi:hypothetical protein